MNSLSKGSAKYVRDNEHMLDQFWVTGMKVKFSDDYVRIGPDDSIEEEDLELLPNIVETIFPPPKQKSCLQITESPRSSSSKLEASYQL